MHLLVVDDDPEIRSLVCELLVSEGYEVDNAENGKEALAFLAACGEDLPQVILLDLMMPVMDGFRFLELVAKSESLSKIPVILTTAANEEIAASLSRLVVRKPYDVDGLLEAVRTHGAKPHR
jgi:CheY-like chemotaxis protein